MQNKDNLNSTPDKKLLSHQPANTTVGDAHPYADYDVVICDHNNVDCDKCGVSLTNPERNSKEFMPQKKGEPAIVYDEGNVADLIKYGNDLVASLEELQADNMKIHAEGLFALMWWSFAKTKIENWKRYLRLSNLNGE